MASLCLSPVVVPGFWREVKIDFYRKEQFLVIQSKPVDLPPPGPHQASVQWVGTMEGGCHVHLKCLVRTPSLLHTFSPST